MTRYAFPATLVALTALSACATKAPVAPPVYIPPPVVQTCTPTSQLTRIVIPAETKEQTAITEIANPPYDPIERRVKRTVIVKPAQVFYANNEGREVLDICEKDVEIGPIGPGPGTVVSQGDG